MRQKRRYCVGYLVTYRCGERIFIAFASSIFEHVDRLGKIEKKRLCVWDSITNLEIKLIPPEFNDNFTDDMLSYLTMKYYMQMEKIMHEEDSSYLNQIGTYTNPYQTGIVRNVYTS